jgi:hypothetical protein
MCPRLCASGPGLPGRVGADTPRILPRRPLAPAGADRHQRRYRPGCTST